MKLLKVVNKQFLTFRADKKVYEFIGFYEQKSVIINKIMKTMIRYQEKNNIELDCHVLL